MDLIKKYLLSSVFRSPDEPAAPEPEAAEVVAEAAPEPVAEAAAPEAVEVEPEPESAVAAAVAPPAAPKWALERLGDETGRRKAAEQERDNYRAMVERLQAGKQGEEGSAPPAKAEQQPQDFNAAVRSEASRLRLMEDSTAVRDAGLRDYGASFGESLSILTAVGATGDDFVLDVLAVDKDNAHKILDKLAKDPERAAAMAGMDSRRRTAELTRMSMAEQAAAPAAAKPAAPAAPAAPKPAISRAPTPKPAIAPHAAAPEVDPTTPEGNDKMDDRAWEAWYKAKYMKRTG